MMGTNKDLTSAPKCSPGLKGSMGASLLGLELSGQGPGGGRMGEKRGRMNSQAVPPTAAIAMIFIATMLPRSAPFNGPKPRPRRSALKPDQTPVDDVQAGFKSGRSASPKI